MSRSLTHYITRPDGRHALAVWIFIVLYAAVIAAVGVYGLGYYRLPLEERGFHPLNRELRPSGVIGIRLGLMGLASFLGIYLYAVRKHWKWLGKVGKTRHWLDVHVVMGIGAPAIITLHAAFKARGLAGTAYWFMMAVMLSGVIGRYLYAQIPRRLNAAELSLQDMQNMTEELTEQLQKQSLVSPEELKPLLAVPPKERVEDMPLLAALLLMFVCDLKRPFLVARARRRAASGRGNLRTAWGLLPSGQPELESVIDLARRRSWMATKISFLARTNQVFHLWHVVHKPFSYSFAILASLHIAIALWMGYY